MMIKKTIFLVFISIITLYKQSNDEIYKALLKKAEDYSNSGEYDKANYYITRYVGLVMSDQTTKMKVDDINTSMKALDLKTTSFISGKYSQEFLDWYFISTYYMWGTPDELTNETELASVVTQTSDEDYFVGVIGQPTIENWSIIGSKDSNITGSYLHLINCHNPPRLVVSSLKIEDQNPLSHELNNEGLYYHYFWQPILKDLNNDGDKEIILRYNVARADGFFQRCDVYAISDTNIILLDSLVGDPEGIAVYISENKFQTGHAFPSSSDIGHLSYDLYEIKNYEFIGDLFQETGKEEVIENILWSDIFKKYFYE